MREFPFLFPGVPERFRGREEIRAEYRAAWGASPLRVRDGYITHVRDYMVGLRVAHVTGRLPAVVESLAGDGD